MPGPPAPLQQTSQKGGDDITVLIAAEHVSAEPIALILVPNHHGEELPLERVDIVGGIHEEQMASPQ